MRFRADRIYPLFLRLTRRLSNRQMMMLLAVVVGVLAGIGTYLFEILLYAIKNGLTNWFPVDSAHFLFLIYPAVGIILATLFVKYIVRDNISEGVTRVLYAMSSRNSRIAAHNCWTSVVGGATTIGFGGSVGPEAPIVLTGAAIGSNIGRLARLNYKNSTLLLCCGAGAALAAIFKAPITGVVFVLEILMLDITAGSVIPLLISSVTATTMAFMLRGFDPILAVTLAPQDAFELWQIPLFILLGMLCGLMAWYFTSMNSRVGNFFKGIDRQWKKWLWGGVILGVLIFIFPPLYGEGYEGFTALMHGKTETLFDNSLFYRFRGIDWVVILFIIATMFFKVIAMASTNAAGGVGGTFAPSLFVGAFTGATLALVCNMLFHWEVSVVSFTLVGMAGVMAGVMNAPLTSIFLIAELSNGYGLFIPLMITACISFAVNYWLDPDSIYTKQLRQKGELLTHDKDQSVFVFLKLDELMETDFLRIKENITLGDIVHIISTARRNIFPVIDNFGRLLGVVQLDDLREDMFKPEKYGRPISDYMIQPPDKILEHESIMSVMEKFEDKHTWMLPVVDKKNRYLGFISKSRILNAYREQLVKIQQ
ncbi:chloride channel protein [Alistipes sp. CAG:268]|jgi:CIC family chloride channel protein|uniref:chloride channel protein n=1 Tax=Alistipes sp. CAG:268 TaxID=1262693 RepID=UPI000339F27F|nr:chloride channel protein [Alistipes sp. CAG:268]CDC95910.1 chloride channel protein EriC [Alistipes sp. CAG:268]HBL70972.1 CBS domain-containing protein [Alistipes sp.]HBW01679.1 CBS domain-containing protein [Alistipes sp.]